MHNLPLIVYPCLFDIKIMGVNSPQLLSEITAIISLLSENFNPDSDIKTKLSSKGTYIAITATVVAQSKEHLDSMYLRLTQHELIKVVL